MVSHKIIVAKILSITPFAVAKGVMPYSPLILCHMDSQPSQLAHAPTVEPEVLGIATVRNAANISALTVSGKK